jgi:uncharacterized protein (DUF2336 family)
MSESASLLSEIEDAIANGPMERRAETLSRVTNLFLSGADRFKDEHVSLFDDVIGHLIREIETKARAELAVRLAPIGNAPLNVLRRLAQDDDIAVAGPVLAQSPRLEDSDLVDIAKSKSQAHLAAISGRTGIAEGVTEVLVSRGNQDVIRKVADNKTARLSAASFSDLARRARNDGDLAEKIGNRPDIPADIFRDLVVRASEVVQKRLLASAKPETRAEIRRVLEKVSGEMEASAKSSGRDFSAAQETVAELAKARSLNEQDLAEFARAEHYEETVVMLSQLCRIPVEVMDRLLDSDRPDPVLILCKAAGFGWQTARAVMLVRPGRDGTPTHAIDSAFANFEKLAPATAQRVVRFWQVGAGKGPEGA